MSTSTPILRRRQEPLTKMLYKKTNCKKVGFLTMAFTTKILSVCSKQGLRRGGHGHPRTPPSYAPVNILLLKGRYLKLMNYNSRTAKHCKCEVSIRHFKLLLFSLLSLFFLVFSFLSVIFGLSEKRTILA